MKRTLPASDEPASRPLPVTADGRSLGQTAEGAIGRSAPELAWRRFMPRGKVSGAGRVAAVIVLALVVIAVAAPILAPHDPNEGDLANTLDGTSASHPLGTDASGRDIMSRLIYGARLSLLGPLVAVGISTLVGVPLGLLAGLRRGLPDAVLSRSWDVLLSFPPLLLAIVIVAAFGAGFWTAAIALTLIYIPLLARVVRGAVLVEREKPYVDAVRVQGFGRFRIAFFHVLPSVAPIVVAQATLNFGYAMLDLAGLAFLGLGVQPPTADWGQMLSTGRDALVLGSYLEVLSASVVIALAVVSFNVLGERLASRGATS